MTIIINAFSVDPAIATKYEDQIAELMRRPPKSTEAPKPEDVLLTALGEREMTWADMARATGMPVESIRMRVSPMVADGRVIRTEIDSIPVFRRSGKGARPRLSKGGQTRHMIAELLAEGLSQCEAAARLGVSQSTVSLHVKAMRESRYLPQIEGESNGAIGSYGE